MKKLPVDYLKLKSIKIKCDKFLEYEDRFYGGELTLIEKIELFNMLSSIFNCFCNYLQYLYKFRERHIYMPVELLITAKKDNIINDPSTWLEYIDDYNMYWQKKNKSNADSIAIKILDKYYKNIDSIRKDVLTSDVINYIKENEYLEQEIMQNDIVLEDSMIHGTEVLGITERSYAKLINYFASRNEINAVWIFGSESLTKNIRNLSINLIVDCSVEKWEDVYKNMRDLAIPHIINAININIQESHSYIKTVIGLGIKKIYCK